MLPKNNNEKELRKLSILSCQKLITAYEKGKLREYIGEEAMSIHRDDDNDITHIVFTKGGPFVYLDFDEQPGLIIAKDFDTKAHSAMPWSIWLEIRNELEEIYE